MPYIAQNPYHFEGRVVGTGQCVAYVQAASLAPNTGSWTAGIKVVTAGIGVISKGTVIATMVDGHYPNHASGNHAAIYLDHDVHGIRVLDQWVGHHVSVRTISRNGGHGNPSNDADAYYVVE